MKKRILFALLIITILVSSIGCKSVSKVYKDIAYGYIAALEALIEEDEGLNGGMKFIAINTKTIPNIDESDKKIILDYFKKYNVKVMDADFETLKDMGLYDENTMSLEGILLSFEEVDKKIGNKIVIEGEKYRSGLGAIGLEITVKYKDGKWEVIKSKMSWIS